MKLGNAGKMRRAAWGAINLDFRLSEVKRVSHLDMTLTTCLR